MGIPFLQGRIAYHSHVLCIIRSRKGLIDLLTREVKVMICAKARSGTRHGKVVAW